jgi:hypothetical protein
MGFLKQTGQCASYWGRGNNLEGILLISPVADLSGPASPVQNAEMQLYNSFSGYRNPDLQLLLRTQEFRFIIPSQHARIIVLSMGGWSTHSSALGLQTQQGERGCQPLGFCISGFLQHLPTH